ncbi:MAG: restriction endonuclease subunit S [Firmicutes bacterium]|nr:restriction endonuclease subunit S [Bacillota bacterium]
MALFSEIFEDRTSLGVKIKTDEYALSGKYAIVDQGQKEIAGYTDREEGVYSDVPALIFGDHTRIVKYIDQPFFLGADGVKLLKARDKDANYKYLYYALQSIRIPNTGYNRHFKWLKEADVRYPDAETQEQVVLILDKLSDLIAHIRCLLTELDTLIKSRFVEMFGDPETNPYGWVQVTVDDVCSSVVRGPFGSALKKEFFVQPDETTYKVYEQKHAIQKSATIGTYYVTAEKYNELRRFECCAGDILMSCSGTTGELYQLPEDCERGIINQALCKFTLNERILPIVFLIYMHETIANLETKGSGIQNIAAVSYVKAMTINLPPMEIQEKFSAFVQKTDKLKAAEQKRLEQTEILFDSLMQRYFG